LERLKGTSFGEIERQFIGEIERQFIGEIAAAPVVGRVSHLKR